MIVTQSDDSEATGGHITFSFRFETVDRVFAGFIQNKACREDYTVERYTTMQRFLDSFFFGSKLKYKGKKILKNVCRHLHIFVVM